MKEGKIHATDVAERNENSEVDDLAMELVPPAITNSSMATQ